MALPELVRRSAEKLFSRYCTGQLPSGHREEMRLSFGIHGDHVTLFAESTDTGCAGTAVARAVARFRFNAELGQWTLHYPDQEQRWRLYLNVGPSLDLGRLLKHVDADPLNIFWE